jgi:branched-chain amino acid transport system permease protein
VDRLGPFLAFVLIDGIAYGMVLFLISVGLSVTMGLMRFANLAHGAFAAIGGAVAITVMTSAGVNFLLALVVAFAATALLGLLLEPFLYAPLYGGDELDQVLMTIGLIFIVIASLNLIFGSTPLPMKLPPWLAASVDIGVRVVPAYRIFLIVVGALLMVVLWLTLDRTEFGARIRAAVESLENFKFLLESGQVQGNASAYLMRMLRNRSDGWRARSRRRENPFRSFIHVFSSSRRC